MQADAVAGLDARSLQLVGLTLDCGVQLGVREWSLRIGTDDGRMIGPTFYGVLKQLIEIHIVYFA